MIKTLLTGSSAARPYGDGIGPDRRILPDRGRNRAGARLKPRSPASRRKNAATRCSFSDAQQRQEKTRSPRSAPSGPREGRGGGGGRRVGERGQNIFFFFL